MFVYNTVCVFVRACVCVCVRVCVFMRDCLRVYVLVRSITPSHQHASSRTHALTPEAAHSPCGRGGISIVSDRNLESLTISSVVRETATTTPAKAFIALLVRPWGRN